MGNAVPNEEPLLVFEPWLRHARLKPEGEAIIHWSLDCEPQVWTWGRLLSAAQGVARRLIEEDVGPGQVCATILRHDPRFYPVYLGIVLAGAIPTVLAYPNARLHPDKFRQGLEGMLRKSGLDFILTESALTGLLAPITQNAASLFHGTLFPYDWPLESRTVLDEARGALLTSADDPCLLQHSSGTTGLQKPVMLSHRAVLDHLTRYARSIDLAPDDRIVSWLPLYHDMGLIAAFHLPLRFGLPLIQLDPFEWVKWPPIMLEAISTTRATLGWMPNFAYNLIAQRADPACLSGLRLDSLRMLVNCSEPVRAASHDLFQERFRGIGLAEGALAACFAMAEATFAVTQTPPGKRARVVAADRAQLVAGKFVPAQNDEQARKCVSSGVPIGDCVLRIVDQEGTPLDEGRVGEVWVKSRSLLSGYRNHPEETARALVDGWYRTGDLAFQLDGELFVIGRLKDVIIVAGKNIYPEDIEDSVSSLGGVVQGRVVAFGLENAQTGTEEICVVAETPLDSGAEQRKLKHSILRAGMDIDVTIGRVVLVPPRWLFKSSSGKPCRKTNRKRLFEDMLV
jgi:fatty-acyl-CoA synthase